MLEDAEVVNTRRDGRCEFRSIDFRSIDTAPPLAAVSRWLDKEAPR